MNQNHASIKTATPHGNTDRQAQIAEIVRDQGHAKVEDLAARFGVATQTIRKDINTMCQGGLLRRVHGGVELSAINAGHYELRRILNLSAKRQIGQAAAALIANDSTVAVSIGTTPELVVAGLAGHSGLRLFSNNLHVALLAHQFDGAEVTIPGGRLRRSEADIVGPTAVDFFDSYKFDYGVFGVAAVSPDGGLLDLSEEDVLSRNAISRRSQHRILVLDSTKFARKAHACSGHITDVEHVICETRPPKDICAMLGSAGVDLIICNEGRHEG